jgi:transposase
MTRTPPIPPELWEQIPPHVRTVVAVIIEEQAQRIAALEAQVVEVQKQVRVLRERLAQTSRNSSKPPSSDGPHVKRKPPKEPSGRKAGGQPGHPVHRRALLPLEEVDEVEACLPRRCRRCGTQLGGEPYGVIRHQVVEVPPVKPHVKEYQLHRLRCGRCGIITCGQLPAGVPAHGYGPRVASLMALCTGAYRMSKRKVASFCREVLGVPVGAGAVCKIEQRVRRALRPVVRQARAYVQWQDTNIDETPWRERSRRRWLWTVVTPQVSVFHIAPTRGAPVLKELLGNFYPGIITSDRAKVYDTHPLARRQVCWAHLRREFQAMIDRGGAAKPVGEILLEHSTVLFAWWHWLREGTWARATFQWYMSGLRQSFRDELERGSRCRCPKTAATCLELLARERALWAFVRVEGIDPTNNSAERQLRHAVLWRKSSYGTQSHRGSQFVATILTVVSSCQQQGRNVLAYLTACCRAFDRGRSGPSLVPRTSSYLPYC